MPPSQGGEAEWFTPDTWVQRDICHHEPWPFPDKHFDFAVCSQTLEDLRDPLWVCSELVRVAKAGYLEVPSRLFESTMAVERPHQAGLSHHRWLIEVSGSHVRFMQIYHMVHADWRFHLPPRFRKRLTPESSANLAVVGGLLLVRRDRGPWRRPSHRARASTVRTPRNAKAGLALPSRYDSPTARAFRASRSVMAPATRNARRRLTPHCSGNNRGVRPVVAAELILR